MSEDVTVKNRIGTGDKKCGPCGTWLDHYKRKVGSIPTFCVEATCTKAPSVGAHVYRPGSAETYIVPFCSGHNAESGAMKVAAAFLAVSATPCPY